MTEKIPDDHIERYKWFMREILPTINVDVSNPLKVLDAWEDFERYSDLEDFYQIYGKPNTVEVTQYLKKTPSWSDISVPSAEVLLQWVSSTIELIQRDLRKDGCLDSQISTCDFIHVQQHMDHHIEIRLVVIGESKNSPNMGKTV